MREKESQQLPEYTLEHVKSQSFLGGAPRPPCRQSIAWPPLFVFALAPHNPLGGPAQNSCESLQNEYDNFVVILSQRLLYYCLLFEYMEV